MSQNRELGELAARVVVDTSGNTITVNNNLIVARGVQANGSYGTSGQALTSNGTGIYWSTIATNTSASYTWTNTHTFSNNVILGSGLSANGSYGTAGQYLTSNGSATFWSTGVTTGKSIAMAIVFGG